MAKKKVEMPKIRRLRKSTLESIRKITSKYIYVTDRKGNAFCERCNSEFILPKTKHLEMCKCPSCKKEMQIVHKWRRTSEERINWTVKPDAISADTLVLRYILSRRIDSKVVENKEVARLVLDFKNEKQYTYECPQNEWKQGTWNFFRESGMGYQYRRLCCLQADEYKPNFFNELKKIEQLRYLNIEELWSNKIYVNSIIINLYNNKFIYEKLQKAGFSDLVKQSIYNSYGYRKIKYDETKHSLKQMLGLNQAEYNYLKDNQTMETICRLQDQDDELPQNIDKIKMLNYIKTNGIAYGEYKHYIYTLKKLNNKMKDRYLYPKDFRAMDKEITEEYSLKKNAIYDTRIKEISDALREMPQLREFMDGSKGLLVYVPENTKDFVEEGKALHNCLRTYPERVAEGKTLVFYIRKLSAPNAPFIAMEYHNGQIVQCRYSCNKPVQDENIIQFTNAFADTLRANKVMGA